MAQSLGTVRWDTGRIRLNHEVQCSRIQETLQVQSSKNPQAVPQVKCCRTLGATRMLDVYWKDKCRKINRATVSAA